MLPGNKKKEVWWRSGIFETSSLCVGKSAGLTFKLYVIYILHVEILNPPMCSEK